MTLEDHDEDAVEDLFESVFGDDDFYEISSVTEGSLLINLEFFFEGETAAEDFLAFLGSASVEFGGVTATISSGEVTAINAPEQSAQQFDDFEQSAQLIWSAAVVPCAVLLS